MWTQTPYKQYYSDEELLTYYNPYYISEKIENMQMYIESSYTRGLPRLTNDGTNVMYESVSVENLAFDVIQLKEDMTTFKIKALHKLRACRYALSRFDKQSQCEIMRYFESFGEYRPDKLINDFSTLVYGIRNKLYGGNNT
ncbi:hypothetical protein QI334_08465 [Staphylococcus saprophyticus]|uniref:hypothetical protein n=1 Tax=Staphylococcus saprophyticus TaxID=29385 RepID=UPI00076AFEF3|nr:hypothetical protein [Staphylococcus saprophyticus]AMG19035.1 hypothetical protein AL528_01830 [Staphylococcus saprophyticus]MDW3863148.1 hypothetical protein [Staphylococcus saprophyticus]MDW3915138.1 hypothetical protein [Staphylococcus saprophyticus]MDW3925372.1 hypothetical protein [Staphylococcus saprophyticus]MDW3963150.1 hypothetical protein [Staphylococcus saprophyticus]